jgi:hypothetical protein
MIDASEFKSGSAFWILFTLLSITGLVYLGIWGFHNSNIKAIAISTIFTGLILFSIVITKLEVFKIDIDFYKACASWFWGFFIFIAIGVVTRALQGQSVLYAIFSSTHIDRNRLFATISSELPIFWEKTINTLTIPYAEEMFWLLGLPVAIMWLMNSLSNIKGADFFSNKVFQFFVIIIVCGSTFAAFHVGKIIVSFIIAALVFRTSLIIMTIGEQEFNFIKWFVVLYSFALGAHMGNNIADDGLMNFILIMQTNVYGWIVMVILFIISVIGFLETIDGLIPGFPDIGGND